MFPYLVLYIITVISLLIYKYKKIKWAKTIPYIAMTFFCGFRGSVGIDTLHYIKMFDYISRGVPVKAELGYYGIVKFIQSIGLGYQIVFIIMSALTSYFIYQFIKNMSINFELSTIIYLCIGPFYFSSYNTMREALSVAIFLYFLKYLDDNIVKYCTGIIIASLFHTSVLLLLILPIFNKCYSKKYEIYFLVLIIIVIIIILRLGIISTILNTIFIQYKNYIMGHYQEMDFSYIIFCFICLIVLIMDHINLIKLNKIDTELILIAIVLITVPLLTNQFTMIFTRMASYVTPCLIIVIPKMSKIIRPKCIWNIMIFLICTLYYFVLLYTNSSMSLYSFNFNIF